MALKDNSNEKVVGVLPVAKKLHKEEETAIAKLFGKQQAAKDNSQFRLNHKQRRRTKEDNQIRTSFNAADRDGDGAIDKVELAQALQSMGKYESESQVEMIIRALDINGNGTVELRELMAFMHAPPVRTSEEEQEEEELALALAREGTDGKTSIASINERLLQDFGLTGALDTFEELSMHSPTKELKVDEMVKMLGKA